MAINLTSSGVEFVAGRGKNKIVTFDMSFKELEDWAKRCGADMGEVIRKSFGRACYGLKQKFYQVVSKAGGVNGVPKFTDFEAFTQELRAKRGRTAPMGGVLAERSSVVAFKKNGYQVVGWPDKMEEWSTRFQDGGDERGIRDYEGDDFRRAAHRMGIRDVPRSYVRNPRRVLPEPFATYVKDHLDEWARGAMYKGLAKMFAKYNRGVA